jgi:II/X family phage/plasmid replication protein
MPRSIVDKIKAKGESHRVVVNETNETRWEITRTNLMGSHDSRIMVRPMYTEFVCTSGKGAPKEEPCPPYLLVECSIPKALYGQNIYGSIEDLQSSCIALQALLEKLLSIELPTMADWRVQRADWAENFNLSYDAIQEYFEGIPHMAFPRRKMHKYGNEAIYIPGTTTTIKFYHKGPEFQKNESNRLFHILRAGFASWSTIDHPDWAELHAKRMVRALQRLANKRLRVEVEIHAEKLDYDFGQKPKVSEVHATYFHELFDKEIHRLLREGKDAMDTVRTARAVHDRLKAFYAPNLADILHGFWSVLSAHGEEYSKANCNRATFYRRRRQLEKAGVSWHGTDVQLIERQGSLLPFDFSPVRANARLCKSPVRERHAFNYERELLKLAA